MSEEEDFMKTQSLISLVDRLGIHEIGLSSCNVTNNQQLESTSSNGVEKETLVESQAAQIGAGDDDTDGGPSLQWKFSFDKPPDQTRQILQDIEHQSFCTVNDCSDKSCEKGYEHLQHLDQHLRKDDGEIVRCHGCVGVVKALIRHSDERSLCFSEELILSCPVPFCSWFVKQRHRGEIQPDLEEKQAVVMLAELLKERIKNPVLPNTLEIKASGDERLGVGRVLHLHTGDYTGWRLNRYGYFGMDTTSLFTHIKLSSLDVTLELLEVSSCSEANLAAYDQLVSAPSPCHHILQPIFFTASPSLICNAFLALPLRTDQTLRDFYRNSSLSTDRNLAKTIIRQILTAADFLHKQLIVYYLWSVDHIFVLPGKPPHILLSDFTYARSSASQYKYLDDDLSEQLCRLPNQYVAPELLLGEDDFLVHSSSDVFAIGCLVYELCTGQAVYSQFGHAHPFSLRLARKIEAIAFNSFMTSTNHGDEAKQFLMQLVEFWQERSHDGDEAFQIPVVADRILDLYLLHKTVNKNDDLEDSLAWESVAEEVVGHRQLAPLIRYHYHNIISPYKSHTLGEAAVNCCRPLHRLRPQPPLGADDFTSHLREFLSACWQEFPIDRPTAEQLLFSQLLQG